MEKLQKNKIVIGLDESGRGTLAGPVIACAVMIKQVSNFKSQISNKIKIPISKIRGLKFKDSKKTTAKKREEIFNSLKNCPEIRWAIGRVSEKIIDKINILQASKLAMKKAINNMRLKIKDIELNNICLLIDGNFKIDLPCYQKSIIKGDEKRFLIKLASIIAKVSRDKIMLNYHKKYPEYGFKKHKGYGTKLHFETLKRYGPCPIHRITFKLIK